MSYTQYLGAAFGSAKFGLATVGYLLFDNANTPVSTRTIAGVVDLGHGWYGATITFPDAFVGRVQWDTGETSPLYTNSIVNSLEQRLLALLTPTRAAYLDKLATAVVSDPAYTLTLATLAADQAVGTLVTRDSQGALLGNVAISFQLVSLPVGDFDSYRVSASFNVLSNDAGLLQVALRRGATFNARRGLTHDWTSFVVPEQDVFTLPQLLGTP